MIQFNASVGSAYAGMEMAQATRPNAEQAAALRKLEAYENPNVTFSMFYVQVPLGGRQAEFSGTLSTRADGSNMIELRGPDGKRLDAAARGLHEASIESSGLSEAETTRVLSAAVDVVVGGTGKTSRLPQPTVPEYVPPTTPPKQKPSAEAPPSEVVVPLTKEASESIKNLFAAAIDLYDKTTPGNHKAAFTGPDGQEFFARVGRIRNSGEYLVEIVNQDPNTPRASKSWSLREDSRPEQGDKINRSVDLINLATAALKNATPASNGR